MPLTVWITTNYGKFWKRQEYPTALPVSRETCMQVKKQQVKPNMEQWTGSKLGKEYVKAIYMFSPCLLNFYTEHLMQNARMGESQAVIKIAGRNINNLRHADDAILMAESKEELKNLLMKVKEKSENVGLKLSIRKMKIMASGPMTLWQIDGETVANFIFWGSKITADGDCNHELKRLAPWKKSYNQPRQHIKKQRHYFANNGSSSQSYGFSSSHVWMWELDYKESLALKNWCF